jgi:hypothetical protein
MRKLVGNPLKPLFGICDFAVFDVAQGGVGNADGFGQLLTRNRGSPATALCEWVVFGVNARAKVRHA